MNLIIENKISPLEPLSIKIGETKGINIWIKREDKIPGFTTGNKFRKLKHNLEAFKDSACTEILSFGGAFSNHLVALAETCAAFKIPSRGFVRGEYDPNNPSIQFMEEHEMKLNFISRQEYRKINGKGYQERLQKEYMGAYIVPEGGSNDLAVQGVTEAAVEAIGQSPNIHWDYWICPCGTGATLGGLLKGLPFSCHLLAVNVLKGLDQRKNILHFAGMNNSDHLTVLNDYHLGGYGKWNSRLVELIQQLFRAKQIIFDMVYTGKMLAAVLDLIQKDFFKAGDNILLWHTGGQQGNKGFNYRFNLNLPY